jgi:hypothetical protein
LKGVLQAPLRRRALPLAASALAVATTVGGLAVQAVSITTTTTSLQVKAPTFTFIDGPVLVRLRDGQTVKVDLELTVLARPSDGVVAQKRQTCQVSFDLWEERFAIARTEPTARTVSHLSAREAEAACIDGLSLPLSSLGQMSRDGSFWIKLSSRQQAPSAAPPEDSGLTIGRLIEVLSRRREAAATRSMEAGPFRLPR